MKLGIIGCGNMGSAIIKGVKNSSIKEIYVYDKNSEKTNTLKETLGVNISPSPIDLVKKTDMIILAVKPNVRKEVFSDIKASVSKNQLVISIMAGVTIDEIENHLGKDKKIVRVMPNTPALVNEAMSAFSVNQNVLPTDRERVKTILESFGEAEYVEEDLMDIVTGISGSSPAYVFMMIEAMADAAVKGGMARDKAYTFVAQAILGSAKMVLETKMHPGVLKDMVTSPRGTTIEAVEVLEKKGFRSSLMKAVEKATERSKELGKK